MSSEITAGAVIISPTLILGYESTRKPGNVIHEILGRESPSVTFRPAGLRRGRMELLFEEESTAADAEAALAAGEVCTLSDDDRTTVAMSFVLPRDGDLSRKLDDETRAAWVVAFDWREVSP